MLRTKGESPRINVGPLMDVSTVSRSQKRPCQSRSILPMIGQNRPRAATRLGMEIFQAPDVRSILRTSLQCGLMIGAS
jgi:hypothetical protein